MPTNRKLVFADHNYYHIFNRGLNRMPVFQNRRDFLRMISILDYYRFVSPEVPFSKYLKLNLNERSQLLTRLKSSPVQVSVHAWGLMSNHFHLLLRQENENGITKFMSKVANSYGKYFNTRTKRRGPVFESRFKAVFVETDEQMVHLSRYIHLNPLVSNLIKKDKFETYEWTSFKDYLDDRSNGFVDKSVVKSHFKTVKDYRQFVLDQAAYGMELERIKHLLFQN